MAIRNWKFHTARLLLAAALIWTTGWLIGYPVVTFIAMSAGFVLWQVYNLWQMHRWIQRPVREIPESYGIWADIYDGLNSMAARNRKQKKKYRALIGEFRSLTDALPDATLAINSHDVITWFNVAATRLLVLRNPDDLGQPITNLLRDPDFANWLAVQGEVKSPLEMACPCGDGRWLSVSAVSFRKNQRLVILRDITELHNMERIRRDFVTNISHEMRTPLTVLQGYLELFDLHPEGDVNNAAKRMLSQTFQMRTLLDDLLELSRLQNSETRGEDEMVNVPAMLLRLKDQAKELSQGDHQLVFDIDPDLQIAGISADLESAFSNLIVNAIKYTPSGGDISVTWQDSADGPQLHVWDNGIGIPRRDIPRLTERFYRVGSDRARQTGGTGLGLAIVKHALNAHQADLSISSDLGEGSEFVCKFPAERTRAGK